MGYTWNTWKIIEPYLQPGMSVCDFGNQMDYTRPNDGNPYTLHRYKELGIDYVSFDVNGKATEYMDLNEVFEYDRQFDIVVDSGTKEHVLSLTNAFKNQYNLTKTNGLMYCANPKVGNWADHGHHYFTQDFYHNYAKDNNCEILLLMEHPACENTVDGWEIVCLMRKL